MPNPPHQETTASVNELPEAKGEIRPGLKEPPKPVLKNRLKFWTPILNSSFTVTVIGGAVLALLGSLLQTQVAKSQKAEAVRAAGSQRKEKIAYDFANEFPSSLSLVYRFKTRKLWLAANQPGSTNRFDDGRNYEDTRALYETVYDRYITTKPPASFCNQIIGSFPLTHIHDLAVSLNLHVNDLIKATNELQVNEAFDIANIDYQELTQAVFTELNKPEKP
jgi:hypothetical protein